MVGLKKYLAIGILSAAILFPCVANAMQIPQFDKMDAHDQGHYITLLVQGVYSDLKAKAKNDQANELVALFNDLSDKGGLRQFDRNLDKLRALNQANAADPNYKDRPYEIEDAMALTLPTDIDVSVDRLLEIGKGFKPAYPPAEKNK